MFRFVLASDTVVESKRIYSVTIPIARWMAFSMSRMRDGLIVPVSRHGRDGYARPWRRRGRAEPWCRKDDPGA
jgi:hypothetical protein